jgi:hypothetical protein
MLSLLQKSNLTGIDCNNTLKDSDSECGVEIKALLNELLD